MPPPATSTGLWDVPAYLDYVQPALTPDAVREAERRFGVVLPAAYLAMLDAQNGGYLRATWPDLPHRRLDGIGPEFPSITGDGAWWQAPDAEDEMWVPSGPDLLVPFDGEGHWDLCFDYRGGGPRAEPAVAYIDIDAEEDLPVADSFEAFLGGLVDEVEQAALRIHADVDLDAFGAAFATASGREVTDQGDWNHGYRQLRARIGERDWTWISPNQVPAGYRRDGDRIVATPETALRLPADPACRLIVECTPDAIEPTRTALRATGYWPA